MAKMANFKKSTKQSAVLGLTIFLDGSTIIKPPEIDYYFWTDDGLDSSTAIGGWLGEHNLAGTPASVIISEAQAIVNLPDFRYAHTLQGQSARYTDYLKVFFEDALVDKNTLPPVTIPWSKGNPLSDTQ